MTDVSSLDTQIETDMMGYDLINTPMLNKGTAFTEAERDTFRLHGLLPPHVGTLDEQVARRLKVLRALRNRLRALCLPARTAGHQRDAVLRAAGAQHRGDAAAGLHADGRRGLPALQRDLAQAARRVPELSQQAPDSRDPGRPALRPRARHRRERRRADSRPRRPGRRRHGHLRSASWRSTPAARASIRTRPCRSCSTSAPTTRSGWTIRSMSAGGTRASTGADYDDFVEEFVAAVDRPLAARAAAMGGFRRLPTPRACWRAIATGCAPSTTTSRAPPRSPPPR